MYPAAFEYFAPRTVDEALELLARYGEDAKILAGGQSLLPMMKLRIASPRYLIDVNRIDGLAGLRREGDRLVIGALCRHADIAASPIVREHLPIMLDAANQTADVQVRNRGTVAGSLAHADPAGDWPAALMALDTDGHDRRDERQRGRCRWPTSSLTHIRRRLGAGEMVIEVSVGIPARPGGGAYVKFEKRAGDFAVASVGVQLGLDGDRCRTVAISLGAVGATPIRARAAETLLQGKAISPDLLGEAEQLVRDAAEPFAGHARLGGVQAPSCRCAVQKGVRDGPQSGAVIAVW